MLLRFIAGCASVESATRRASRDTAPLLHLPFPYIALLLIGKFCHLKETYMIVQIVLKGREDLFYIYRAVAMEAICF